jgi:predicted SAM-dependent methyltransferase
MEPLLLNVGGYKEIKEKVHPKNKWVVVDIEPAAEVVVDISVDKLPFKDTSVDAIYCSHTLEHIRLDRLPFVFSEFHRVLKRNSKARIVVPDWDIAIREYQNKNFKFLEYTKVVVSEAIYPNIPLINLFSWAYSYHFNNGKMVVVHKTPFNKEVLCHFFRKAGFVDLQLRECQDCDEIFNGLDLEGHRICSLYMEAVKR